ncbi:uncharacterized protein LOC129602643 [Paramacrobiotus metropolitanus]|uniref:uncharacterized protein LOC129602643 n=1 Tax=Paramacrobiotus metropolitanus TaxID=2943436 RepID=UPI002445FA73|nr:uncharacterized protein LOC129602643 [Paramacrobiotus metropolitanus]
MSSTQLPSEPSKTDQPVSTDEDNMQEDNHVGSDSEMDELEMEDLEASDENLSTDEEGEEEATGEVMWQIVRDNRDEDTGELQRSSDEYSDDENELDEPPESDTEAEHQPSSADPLKSSGKEDLVRNSLVHPMIVDEDDDSDYSNLEHGLPPKLVIPFTFETIKNQYFPNESSQRRSSKQHQKSKNHKSPALSSQSQPSSSNQLIPSPLRNIPSAAWPSTAEPENTYPELPREPARFPPKTVRRVMTFLTCTEDIRVSHPAVDAVSIALECFVRNFTKEAYQYAQRKGRNVLRYDDLAYIGNHYANLYFLQDYLPPQEAAGYVVRKVLEESGVGFPSETPPNNADAGESSSGKKAVEEKNSNKAADSRSQRNKPSDNPLVETATEMARMWDADSKLKKWRSMNRHSGKGKGSKT